MGKQGGAGRSVLAVPKNKPKETVKDRTKKVAAARSTLTYNKREGEYWRDMMTKVIQDRRVHQDASGSFYTQLDNSVHFTPDAGEATILHEFSHYFDKNFDKKGRVSAVSDRYFDTERKGNKAYREAFKSDMANIAKEMGFTLNSSGTNITGTPRENSLKLAKFVKDNGLTNVPWKHLGQFTDIISAMTHEKAGGTWNYGGHTESYWNRLAGLHSGEHNAGRDQSMEVFAQYSALRQAGQKELLATFRRLTPNLYKIMQKRYKQIWRK